MRTCSVRKPRNVSQESNGAPVTPQQLAHHASSVTSAAVAATTVPPTTSEWPLRYLVVEWTTKSAPSVIGFCSAGERKVLSTARSEEHTSELQSRENL